MTRQGQMLMSMIGAAVNGLRNLEKLTPDVRDAWTGAYQLLSDVMQQGAMEPAMA